MLSWDERLPLKADILKVAHHGSNISSSYQFIATVEPDYAIVSCGKNDDDYPHVETAMTLMDCGVSEIMTTQQLGNIFVRIYKTGNYMISGQKMQKFILVK